MRAMQLEPPLPAGERPGAEGTSPICPITVGYRKKQNGFRLDHSLAFAMPLGKVYSAAQGVWSADVPPWRCLAGR